MNATLEVVELEKKTIGALRDSRTASTEPLSGCLKDALNSYFMHLGDQQPNDLYDLVISVVEKPLLESVLEYTRGNQTRAAQVLGISRSTLRKKMALLGIR